MLGGLIDAIMGNPSSTELNNIVGEGMEQYISGIEGMGNQLGDYAKSAMAFQSGQNQAQRQMLQDQAARASAMGGMQAQRMAAQQGMGGSGLLQQAQANQAYQNMVGAGTAGLKAFLDQQRLGAGYLGQASQILGQAGEMQSELNVSKANILQNQARGRGQFLNQFLGNFIPGLSPKGLAEKAKEAATIAAKGGNP